MSPNLWRFNKKKAQPFRVPFEQIQTHGPFAEQILKYCQQANKRDLIILCVGTDRSTGDSLGPLIGSKLEILSLQHFHVYGTLEYPVHAMNLADRLAEVNSKHDNPFIIAIDACLGQEVNVGSLTIQEGPLHPGAAVHKNLPKVGDIHITGIVNVGGAMEFYVLQNTRLHIVMSMAESIAQSLYLADQQISSSTTTSPTIQTVFQYTPTDMKNV
ncbi:spore protease YyaC [Alkalicoccobacillus plakortidis]|uniref:Spore protease YyaC n=1 Tax=Alkalicoccobacillus plakortidis TaxID=444060 RepID=A0ABT0XKK3_9BACI|nr:spore protease YyaC [Alkalicoccobacillus plakortidis]MCM2676442.1 spore protease YyaC [Alkalicoccobacillus plakortidis]